MALAKTTKINGEWVKVSLSLDEINQAMDNLRQFNTNELKRCMEIAKEELSGKSAIMFAGMLFEKQGMSSFTALTEAIEEKIDMLKTGITKEFKPKTVPIKKEIKKESFIDDDDDEDEMTEEDAKAMMKSIDADKLKDELDDEEINELKRELDKRNLAPGRTSIDKIMDKETDQVSNDIFGKEWNQEKKRFIDRDNQTIE